MKFGFISEEEVDKLIMYDGVYEKNRLVKCPLFVYAFNTPSQQYMLIEIDDDFMIEINNHDNYIPWFKLNARLHDIGYEVLITDNNKSSIIQKIKDRYLILKKNQLEIADLEKIFNVNPEFII